MRPAVTMILLEMGLELPDIETALDIEAGLKKLNFELRPVEAKTRNNKSSAARPKKEPPANGTD